VLPIETTLNYEIELDGDNSRVKNVQETELYAEADIAVAIADYQAAITA
jgi:hypothetical protein